MEEKHTSREKLFLKCSLLAWDAWYVAHDLHDEEGEELVLLGDLLRLDGVAVVVVGEHDQPPVPADQQQPANTQHVPPDRSIHQRVFI